MNNMNKMLEQLIDQLETHCSAAVPVGSRVTCNPPPMDTDQDILCRCDDVAHLCGFQDWLVDQKWKEEGNYGDSNFTSWKKTLDTTVFNLIVAEDEDWFDKFLEATVICMEKNLLVKADRIAVFDKVMGRTKKINWGVQGNAAAQLDMLAAQYNYNLAAQQNQAAYNLQAQNALAGGQVIHDAVYYDDIVPVPQEF